MSEEDRLIGLSEADKILRDRQNGNTKLHKRENGRLVIDHERTANAMAMFIANTPMDTIIKKILLMRIGAPLIHKKPMSHMAIALHLGMMQAEVKELERIGLDQCNEFMERSTGVMFAGTDNKKLVIDTMNEVNETKGIE